MRRASAVYGSTCGLALIAMIFAAGCSKEEQRDPKADTSATPPAQPAPAGADVLALLGGVKVGDEVEGYVVTWIGAVASDGAIRVLLEQGGRRMRLVVALYSEEPNPPVRTEKYALYYESLDHRQAAGEDDCKRVLEQLAKKIRRVEDDVPAPSGMRVRPGHAMPM